MHAVLVDGNRDLLICSAEIDGVFLGDLVKEIRHARLHNHPFPVIVMLLPSAEHDLVSNVINCGPDDILLMPVSPAQLWSRIEPLLQKRKPFIVTRDYIGPDRRKEKRQDGQMMPPLEVPNPLAARLNAVPPARLEQDIGMATQRLNIMKVDRDGVQIRWLGNAIHKLIKYGPEDRTAIREHVLGLSDMAKDVTRRTEGWPESQIPEGIKILVAAIKTIPANARAMSDAQLSDFVAACERVDAEIRRLLPVRIAFCANLLKEK
jgi:CheY-like chemotaxis protein